MDSNSEKRTARRPFFDWLLLFLLLAVIWIIFSGVFEAKFIIFGTVSCAVIAFVCRPFLVFRGKKTDKEFFLLAVRPLRFLVYIAWLMKEIVMSALAVSKNILKGNLSPEIVFFKADYDDPAARALLANSITLTPGTVTVDISEDGVYSVHALTREFAEGLLEGGMQRRIAWVYGEEIDYRPIVLPEVVNQGPEVLRLKAKRYAGRRKAL